MGQMMAAMLRVRLTDCTCPQVLQTVPACVKQGRGRRERADRTYDHVGLCQHRPERALRRELHLPAPQRIRAVLEVPAPNTGGRQLTRRDATDTLTAAVVSAELSSDGVCTSLGVRVHPRELGSAHSEIGSCCVSSGKPWKPIGAVNTPE